MSGRKTSRRNSSANRTLTNPTLVAIRDAFLRLIDDLCRQPLIALDTESDSLYSYYPKVCLIQITTYADPNNPDPDQVIDYLVDPLRLETIDELGKVLAAPEIEIVMHAAENDILTLQRDFQFRFNNIYDTQLAARILGKQGIGLAAILERQFGLSSDKRMQRTNWGKRPLTPQQIAYAQMDTHYLPALRTRQIAELEEAGRLGEARAAFHLLAKLDFAGRPENERSFWQMKIARKFPREDTAVLESLWQWREQEAQRRNRPPFRIVNDSVLGQIAQQRPADSQALQDIHGLSDYQIRRYGDELLAALHEGEARPLPKRREPNHNGKAKLKGIAQVRYEALREWRRDVAKARGVDADIIFSNSVLMEIAQRAPQSAKALGRIPDVGSWKAQTYAPDILPLMNGKIDRNRR